jgi:hypothetical protein
VENLDRGFRKSDLDLFYNVKPRVFLLDENDALPVDLIFDGIVVGAVVRFTLRRKPQSVTTVVSPALVSSEGVYLGSVLEEQIVFTYEREVSDANSVTEGDAYLNYAIVTKEAFPHYLMFFNRAVYH